MKFKYVGKTFNTEIWSARAGKYSFVISENEAGYASSYKDATVTTAQASNFIEGSPFSSFEAAADACYKVHKQLKRLN